MTRTTPSSPVGLHRVIEPRGVLPQAATRVNASPEIWPDEVRVAVSVLNLDAASRLVRQTFEEVAKEAQRLEGGGTINLDSELLSICWRLYKKGGTKDSNQSKSQVVKVLKDLSVEERVILVGTDVLGIAPNDMMKIVNVEGVSFRRNLAKARGTLLGSSFEI